MLQEKIPRTELLFVKSLTTLLPPEADMGSVILPNYLKRGDKMASLEKLAEEHTQVVNELYALDPEAYELLQKQWVEEGKATVHNGRAALFITQDIIDSIKAKIAEVKGE